jgi:hypothetical protein
MRLRNPDGIDRAIVVLGDLEGGLSACRGHEDTVPYLAWCADASRQLRQHFVSPELAELAERDQRDLTLGGTTLTRPREFLDRSIDIWQARLNEAKRQFEALRPFVSRAGQIVVADTSAFIEGVYFTEVDWRALDGITSAEPVRLVVPIAVIDELDGLKRDRNARVSDRARSVLRALWELHGPSPLTAVQLRGRSAVTVEVLLDDSWHERHSNTDAEIIDRAVYTGELTGRSVLLVAGDNGMLYRAAAAGLKAVLMLRRDDGDAVRTAD